MNILIQKLFDILFPRYCISCGRCNSDGKYKYICQTCQEDITYYRAPHCLHCGNLCDFPENVNECCKCKQLKHHFNFSYSITQYCPIIASLIAKLKYHKDKSVLTDLETLFINDDTLKDFLGNALITYVPLHKKKEYQRSFNQSYLIAKKLSNISKNNLINILERNKHTPTQTGLSITQRKENVYQAFSIKRRYKDTTAFKDKRLIIIDDVMTTGATLSECARIAKKLKFKQVDVLTLARRTIS